MSRDDRSVSIGMGNKNEEIRYRGQSVGMGNKTDNDIQSSVTRGPESRRISIGMGNKSDETYYVECRSPRNNNGPAPTYKPAYSWSIQHLLVRECLAEFIGTYILVVFGLGVIAQVVLSGGEAGSFLSINFCWALGLMFGIYFSGGISGAHLNPAVSFALAVFGRFEWYKLPIYALTQTFASFMAAATIWAVYHPALKYINDYTKNTAGIFATYPKAYEGNAAALFTEIVGTALLLAGIFALGDEKNQATTRYNKPASVALLLMAIGMSFGLNTGFALNPARDFGPRILTACGPWGSKVFKYDNYYFWVPLIGPFIGAVLGAGIYELFIEAHHPILVPYEQTE